MARVLVDANVIVSAAFGGVPLKAVIKSFRNDCFVSTATMNELLLLPDELSNKLSPDHISTLKRLIKVFFAGAVTLNVKTKIRICRDPEDNAYLSLCKKAKADYMVTGDHDLHVLTSQELNSVGLTDLTILSPSKFIKT